MSFVTAVLVALAVALSPINAAPASATGTYDYFCKNSYGTTVPWNGRNQLSCDGFLYSYRDGTYMGKVNIPLFIAQNSTPISWPNMDRWCTNHAFYCTVAVGGFFYTLTFVTGGP